MLTTPFSLVGLVFTCTVGMNLEQKELFEKRGKYAFQFFDFNNDGYHTKAEAREFADLICSLSNTTDEDCAFTRFLWEKWVEFISPNGTASLEQYFQKSEELLNIYPDQIFYEDLATYSDLFDKIDSDKDSVGSPEEIRRYYALFGYGDDYDIDTIVRSIDVDHDGQVSRIEFASAGAFYWTNMPDSEDFYHPQKSKKY